MRGMSGGTRNRLAYLAVVALVLAMALPQGALAITLPGATPTANPDSYTTAADIPVVPLHASAPGVLANDDGGGLTAIKVSDPSHGAVALSADGSFTYTPTGGFAGTDSFTYKAHNGAGDSAAATVTIAVAHVNQPPAITKPNAQTVKQGTPLVFSAANTNAITVTDPDAGTNPIKINLGVLTRHVDGRHGGRDGDGQRHGERRHHRAAGGDHYRPRWYRLLPDGGLLRPGHPDHRRG